MTPSRTFEAAWYAHGYLRELVLIYPTYAIMMGAAGISPLELSLLFVIWAGTALVLEVPSGTLADLYSRKHLLALANLLKASAFLIWLLVPTFTGFAAGFVLWGTGSSLASGTTEALLYDTLRARGDIASFSRIYGRGMAANSLGVATALFAGGFMAEYGYGLPLVLSIAASCLAALVALGAFTEVRSAGGASISFSATLREGLAHVRRSSRLAYLLLVFASFVGIYGSLEEYIGPFLAERGDIPLSTIGIIYGLAFVARSLGVAFAHRLGDLSIRRIIVIFTLSALPLALTRAGTAITVAIAFATYFALCAAAEVLLQARLQAQMNDGTRATATSVAGMGQMITGILLYLALGSVAESCDWAAALMTAAALMLILGALFWFWVPQDRV